MCFDLNLLLLILSQPTNPTQLTLYLTELYLLPFLSTFCLSFNFVMYLILAYNCMTRIERDLLNLIPSFLRLITFCQLFRFKSTFSQRWSMFWVEYYLLLDELNRDTIDLERFKWTDLRKDEKLMKFSLQVNFFVTMFFDGPASLTRKDEKKISYHKIKMPGFKKKVEFWRWNSAENSQKIQ